MSTILNNDNKHDLSSSYEILDNLRTAILILDTDFNYVYTNISAIDLLGSATPIKEISELRCENISLSTYLNNIRKDSQSVMLRDLKFKNFDRIEKIVDCNISSYYSGEIKYILLGVDVEFSQIYKVIETGINDTQTTIAIVDFEVNLPLEESLFVFDKEKYKDYYMNILD